MKIKPIILNLICASLCTLLITNMYIHRDDFGIKLRIDTSYLDERIMFEEIGDFEALLSDYYLFETLHFDLDSETESIELLAGITESQIVVRCEASDIFVLMLSNNEQSGFGKEVKPGQHDILITLPENKTYTIKAEKWLPDRNPSYGVLEVYYIKQG